MTGMRAVPPEAGTRLWTVTRGDALALVSALPDESIDALVTDMPYSSGGMWKRDRENTASASKYLRSADAHEGLSDFEGDSRDQRGFFAWASLWLAEAYRAAKETATDALQSGGWVWRGVAVWDKLVGRPAPGKFRCQCEYMIWGSKGKLPATDVNLPGCFPIPFVRTDKRLHPTEKSLRLMRQIVRLAKPGGLVLDPFAGAGTTGAAAVLEGRRAMLFELKPHYVETSRRYCAWAEERVGKLALTEEVPVEAVEVSGEK